VPRGIGMFRRRCICRVIRGFREVMELVVRECLVERWWERMIVVMRRLYSFFYFISCEYGLHEYFTDYGINFTLSHCGSCP
jgi:hypothetical protein